MILPAYGVRFTTLPDKRRRVRVVQLISWPQRQQFGKIAGALLYVGTVVYVGSGSLFLWPS